MLKGKQDTNIHGLLILSFVSSDPFKYFTVDAELEALQGPSLLVLIL